MTRPFNSYGKPFADYHIVDLLTLANSPKQLSYLDREDMLNLIEDLAGRLEDHLLEECLD